MKLITVLGASGFTGLDFRSLTIDSTPFRAVTGSHPEISLSEGVRRTVAASTKPVHGKARA
jgi:reductase EvaE